MNLPPWLGVAILALFLGVNGVWLAGRMFWHRQRSIFWLASSVILGCVAYLVLTGAGERIARGLWPIAFDPIKGKEFVLRAPCEQPRSLGFALIGGPIALLLTCVLLLRYRDRPILVSMTVALFSVGSFFLYASPLPEKLARFVLPEDMHKVPSHCGSAAL